MGYKLVFKCKECSQFIREIELTEARFIHIMDVMNTSNLPNKCYYVGDHVLTSYDDLCTECYGA